MRESAPSDAAGGVQVPGGVARVLGQFVAANLADAHVVLAQVVEGGPMRERRRKTAATALVIKTASIIVTIINNPLLRAQ